MAELLLEVKLPQGLQALYEKLNKYVQEKQEEKNIAEEQAAKKSPIAITPFLPTIEPEDSLSMGDEHLSTIPEKEESSVEDLVPIPSELSKVSVIDDESSHEEVIHEMSFKTYSNPLFDLDEEIISSEFNPIHNEDLDSTPKDVCFDAESYLLESLVNHDTLMVSPPKIDFLLDEFADELTHCDNPRISVQ
ncbi:hypothetical protein Tco_0049064 [Tanacetum coccineum]